MRVELPRRLPAEEFLLLGPVSAAGLRFRPDYTPQRPPSLEKRRGCLADETTILVLFACPPRHAEVRSSWLPILPITVPNSVAVRFWIGHPCRARRNNHRTPAVRRRDHRASSQAGRNRHLHENTQTHSLDPLASRRPRANVISG